MARLLTLFRIFLLLAVCLSGFFVGKFIYMPIPSEDAHLVGRVFLDSQGKTLRVILSENEQIQYPVELHQISPWMLLATMAAEDKRFFGHGGIDGASLVRAIGLLFKYGDVVSGASTITMQNARMFNPQVRNLSAKIDDMMMAIKMERKYSKRWIMQFYLNRAPYGGNLIGVQAAAMKYFGKDAKDLTLPEAALLAGIPKNPNVFHPFRNRKNALNRMSRILNLMEKNKWISTDQMKIAMHASINVGNHPFPFQAPHWVDWIENDITLPGVHRTSLQLSLQKKVESSLESHVASLPDVFNGAVVVLDNQTGKVLSMVGNSSYFDPNYGGQINMAMQPRSPGSTLKPFLYLKEFEDGNLLPHSLLLDIPTHYSGLDPVNFNRKHNGLVTVRKALQESLNVPAIRLLKKVGPESFMQYLKTFPFTTFTQSAQHYGLGFITGSCEVSLLELCKAYAVLGNAGQGANESRSWEFESSSYLITQILSSRPIQKNLPITFAYKTGTSHQFRDAWCVGYTPKYTVGVWLGNCSRQPSAYLIGQKAAFPLLEKVFYKLYESKNPKAFSKPFQVIDQQVCSKSGLIAKKFCPTRKTVSFLEEVTISRQCDIHQFILNAGETSKGKVVEHWPAELTRFWAKSGIEYTRDNASNIQIVAMRTKKNGRVRILSPVPHETYMMNPEDKREGNQILFKAAVPNDANRVYWFVNGKLIQSSSRTKDFFWNMKPGLHRVSVMDDQGRYSKTQFEVITASL